MVFLQSPEWEEFQRRLGRKTWRMGGALVIRHDLPGGFNYLYSPRPSLVTGSQLSVIKESARKEGSIFLKIDPTSSLESNFPREVRLRQADPLQPQKTVVLDLQKSEGELLQKMHEKTRYNLRLAERHGVLAENLFSPTKSGLDKVGTVPSYQFSEFWSLLNETAKRDRFRPHERIYYEEMLAVQSGDFSNELFLAYYQKKALAAAVVNFYKPGGVATYLHGASSREDKHVMAPQLLHWRIIQESKARGFKHYDFWGIDEKRWPGLTRFKLGFGGEVIEYPPTIDVVYRPMWYKIYLALK